METELNRIKQITKKNPSWQKKFIDISKNQYIDLERLESLFKFYQKNKNILKNINPNILKKEDTNSIEKFEDSIYHEYYLNKFYNFIKKNKRGKYKTLFNDETEIELKSLFLLGVEPKIIQKELISPIASYKSKNDFLLNIKNFKSKKRATTIQDCINEARKLNIPYFIINDKEILLQFYTRKELIKFAPNSWCISRSDTSFNDYNILFKRQFIYFDYSQKNTEKNSIIGYNIDYDNKITDSFDAHNEIIKDKNTYLEEITPKFSKKDCIQKDIGFLVNKSLSSTDKTNKIIEEVENLYFKKSTPLKYITKNMPIIYLQSLIKICDFNKITLNNSIILNFIEKTFYKTEKFETDLFDLYFLYINLCLKENKDLKKIYTPRKKISIDNLLTNIIKEIDFNNLLYCDVIYNNLKQNCLADVQHLNLIRFITNLMNEKYTQLNIKQDIENVYIINKYAHYDRLLKKINNIIMNKNSLNSIDYQLLIYINIIKHKSFKIDNCLSNIDYKQILRKGMKQKDKHLFNYGVMLLLEQSLISDMENKIDFYSKSKLYDSKIITHFSILKNKNHS